MASGLFSLEVKILLSDINLTSAMATIYFFQRNFRKLAEINGTTGVSVQSFA